LTAVGIGGSWWPPKTLSNRGCKIRGNGNGVREGII